MVDDGPKAAPHARKVEDTSVGCTMRATNDRALAEDEPNPQMRARLEGSATVWTARATLLQRLEKGRPEPADGEPEGPAA